jgi:hypothetical protein
MYPSHLPFLGQADGNLYSAVGLPEVGVLAAGLFESLFRGLFIE